MTASHLSKRTRVKAGVAEVRCSKCETWKAIDDFPMHEHGTRSGRCKTCKNAAKKRYREEGRLKYDAEKMREYSRRYERENRETRRAQHAAYMARVRADPVRRAKMLEARRIAHRLRNERAGRPVLRAPKAAMVPSGPSLLPSEPLAQLIARLVDQRIAIARVMGAPHEGRGGEVREVCEELGISPRSWTAWRSGAIPMAQVGVVERVLLNAGVAWYEVYSYDDYAAHFLADVEVPS